MKTRDNRPLREHFEVPTDMGEALRTFDYIEELEAYINHLELLHKPAVINRLSSEIKYSLSRLNEIAVYYIDDKENTNSICRELRKIHKRVDKLSALNGL